MIDAYDRMINLAPNKSGHKTSYQLLHLLSSHFESLRDLSPLVTTETHVCVKRFPLTLDSYLLIRHGHCPLRTLLSFALVLATYRELVFQ